MIARPGAQPPMKVHIPFTKASGAGNDFVLINNFKGTFRLDFARLALAACDRHFGIGADGLLVLERSTKADFLMRYYNADGSWGGMCGNGGRCIARFALKEGIAGTTQHFEALDYMYDAVVGETSVRLHMKDAAALRAEPVGQKYGLKGVSYFIDTGAPHAVVLEDALEVLDVHELGRRIRIDPAFAPDGTNVNFIRRKDEHSIEVRTYERGVEAETLACGTGSVASALVASEHFRMTSPVHVLVRSGEELLVHFHGQAGRWNDIYLEGSAHLVFSGTMIFETDPPTISSPE